MIPHNIRLPMPLMPGESTSAELRRVKAELGSALSRLNRIERQIQRLPANHREVMEWFARHDLDPAARPALVFAYLREDFQPTEGAPTE